MAYSLVDVRNPEHKIFKLPLLHFVHLVAAGHLNEFCLELTAFVANHVVVALFLEIDGGQEVFLAGLTVLLGLHVNVLVGRVLDVFKKARVLLRSIDVL